ncbi:hypothetical protein CALCODRAFT_511596 [Calocera cornea HHB12733]|uniref:Uncharacterized protein n=1 Tax=Calocera cornea HHB12733 TaxID=1353952 RepID=A0A165DNI3_9BASI|nr:hypothetical protein CALCODRAFT_511596 [Calocera cornea HHB12733]
MAPVQLGDYIYIHAHDAAPTVRVAWSQSWSSNNKDYKFFMAKTGAGPVKEEVPLYIASELADDSQLAGLEAVTTDDGACYRIRVDDRFQYGQKNKAGDGRFLVWHDKSRRPYQHRFVDTTIQLKVLGVATSVADYFGYSKLGDLAGDASKALFGDYLHTF